MSCATHARVNPMVRCMCDRRCPSPASGLARNKTQPRGCQRGAWRLATLPYILWDMPCSTLPGTSFIFERTRETRAPAVRRGRQKMPPRRT